MGSGFRKFLAATQAVGGLAVLATPVLLTAQGFAVAWWYWLLLGCLGGAAVTGGIELWRDEPRGWRLSRIIQALQIVQIQTSSWGIAIAAGFQLRLLVSEASITAGPAFYGTFALTAGENLPWWLSINFFSAYAFYALLRSDPHRRRATDAPQEALDTPRLVTVPEPVHRPEAGHSAPPS
jgi:hypothetical protein